MTTIKFPSLTWFTGRNGLFKSSGISIDKTAEGNLWLSPITSKGTVARCDIIIHKESIPEFISAISGNIAINRVTEPTYVLFGTDAVDIFDQGGVKAFNKAYKKDNEYLAYTLAKFQPNTPAGEILEAGDGWNSYTILTKSQYQKLSKL